MSNETAAEKTPFELAIERSVGESIEVIRSTPICVRRKQLEKKFGRKMRFVSYWPFIGRGEYL